MRKITILVLVLGTFVFLVFQSYSVLSSWKQENICAVNMSHLGMAIRSVTFIDGGPPADYRDKKGKPLVSWRVALLPHLEESLLFNQYNCQLAWDSPANMALVDKMPKVFQCPSSDDSARPGETRFKIVAGPGTLFDGPIKVVDPEYTSAVFPDRLRAIPDEPSRTILMVEAGEPVIWTKPGDERIATGAATPILSKTHSSCAHVLFADLSVRSLPASTPSSEITALLTRDGGEPIDVSRFALNAKAEEFRKMVDEYHNRLSR